MNLSLTRSKGTLAQLVEQRTENPCVPGSIPGGTTQSPHSHEGFCFKSILEFYYIYSTSKIDKWQTRILINIQLNLCQPIG